MDYTAAAKEIIRYLGGVENIKSVNHCMTRLRFVLKNESAVEAEKLKKVNGIMGLMVKGGQHQVIIGNSVGRYYQEIVKQGKFAPETSRQDEKGPVLQLFVNYISGSMSPIITALIGGGMIKVIVILLELTGFLTPGMQTHTILSLFGDAPFYFMPVMLAYSTAAKFGINQMLAVVIAGIMIHPSFISLVGSGEPVSFIGLPVTPASYSSSVIPILMMTWVMKYADRGLDKLIPDVAKSFLKPILFIFLCGTLLPRYF